MLQIDGNTYSDILADKIIVEANKLGIVESLFVLINNTSSLTKQQPNGSAIKGELKAFHVLMETWYEDVVLGTWVKSSILFSRDKASDSSSAQKNSLLMILSTMFLSKTTVNASLSMST